jgi:hypothetical protein
MNKNLESKNIYENHENHAPCIDYKVIIYYDMHKGYWAFLV